MLNLILIKDKQPLLEQLTYLLANNNDPLVTAELQSLVTQLGRPSRRRLMVKRGIEYIALKLEDIILFYTENKLVYLLDRTGKKYITEKHLADLEQELDPSLFFRANRQYIINVNFIKGFKPYEKVKLLVDLTLPDLNHQVIVSQETAPEFRKWMFNA